MPKKRAVASTTHHDSSDEADNRSQRRRLTDSQQQGPGATQRRPAQTQPARRPMPTQRREDSEEDDEEEEGSEGGHGGGDQEQINIARLSKKLVRLALASEFTRQPIRRTDISTKVLGTDNKRSLFQPVFLAAQSTLRHVFGMDLVELPLRDKITVSQKRAAQRTQSNSSQSSSSKSYMLVTILPPQFRGPEILGAGSTSPKEESYVGLVTAICTLIYLNGRSLSETKLDRYLRRMNIEINTPIDKTEKLLATMCKQGYLNRVKDNTGGETSWEYHLGPRAKLEIGKSGVVNLVEEVYGIQAPENVAERVGKNIGVEEVVKAPGARKGRRGAAATQSARGGDDGEDDDDDDDSE